MRRRRFPLLTTRAASLQDRLRDLSPLAFWPLDDPAGSVTARDLALPFSAIPSAVTFGVPGPAAPTAARFDGTASYIDIYTIGLDATFTGQLFSVLAWCKIAAATWIDGAVRRLLSLRVSGTNEFTIDKAVAANTIRVSYTAGAGTVLRDVPCSSTDWVMVAATIDKANNRMIVYLDGVKQGATITGLGVWAGSLDANRTLIGATTKTPAAPFKGDAANVMIFSRELTVTEIGRVVS